MQTNNFWATYPKITCKDKQFKISHPKLTVSSKINFDITCSSCKKSFMTCPKDFVSLGFCQFCHYYLITLDKESLKNTALEAIVNSKSIEEYFDAISGLKPYELGYIQEFFAMMYFKIHKHLFNIEKYFSYSFDETDEICKLGLPKNDLGTDAVIVHTDKTISLIQVKWRSKQSCHNRSVFAGMSIDALDCKAIVKHLFLFSNSNELSKNLPTTEKFKYILLSDLMNMDWGFFKKNVEKYKTFGKICSVPPVIKYRNWQIEAKKFVSQHKKVCSVIAPCGSGKTLFAHSIIRDLDSYKVLIVVPSLQLLSQWFYNFAIREKSTEFLLVGSQHEENEADVAYTLTTSKEVIQGVFDHAYKKFVTICTYHSLKQVYECDFSFDITFADEAHLTTGTGEFTIVNKKDFKTDKRIFLTATPKIFKGEHIENVVSMDDEKKYGKQFTYSCRQAIEDKILCDYNVILGNAQFEEGTFDDNRHDLYAKFLCICLEQFNLKRVLIASNSHASSLKFHKTFIQMYKGDIKTVLMRPNASACDKNKVLAEINKTPLIIFNVRIFNLGTDIPSLEAVFFNGDKGSKIDIVQTAMRCLRVHENKEKAYIIVPAFMGEDLDSEGDFPMVRNTLSALGAQDTFIHDEIVLKARGKKIPKKKSMIQYVGVEGDVDFGEISTKVFDRLGNLNGISWDVMFLELVDHLEKNDELPKRGSKYNKLANWIRTQRQNKDNLSKDQIKLLKSIKYWSWDPLEDQWNTHCIEVKAYVEKNDELPKYGSKYDKFANWIGKQRQNKDNLSKDQIKLLESIKCWSWDPLEDQWNTKWSEVKAYVEKNDDLPKQGYEYNKLANWIGTQRKNYKKEKLSPQKIKQLEEIPNWKW